MGWSHKNCFGGPIDVVSTFWSFLLVSVCNEDLNKITSYFLGEEEIALKQTQDYKSLG